MTVPDETACWANDEPICPYCGAEQGDAWELGSGGEEDGTTECGSCSRPFRYSRCISVTYSTSPIIGPHRLDSYFVDQDAEDHPLEKP